jgi:hypothetical protein
MGLNWGWYAFMTAIHETNNTNRSSAYQRAVITQIGVLNLDHISSRPGIRECTGSGIRLGGLHHHNRYHGGVLYYYRAY